MQSKNFRRTSVLYSALSLVLFTSAAMAGAPGPAYFSESGSYSYSYYPPGVTSSDDPSHDFGSGISGSGKFQYGAPVNVTFGGSGSTTGKVSISNSVSLSPVSFTVTDSTYGSSHLWPWWTDETWGSSEVEASLRFDVEVLGPSGLVPVQEQFAGLYYVDGAFAWGSANVQAPGIDESYSFDYLGGSEVLSTSYLFEANKPYSIYLGMSGSVSAMASDTYDDVGSFTVSIVPTFAVPSGYSVEFSPALVSPTPEPTQWAIFLAGFGVLGFVMRGSRRKKALATA